MATDRPGEGSEEEQLTADEGPAEEPSPKDDEVDEQSEQSFPASDPPAY